MFKKYAGGICLAASIAGAPVQAQTGLEAIPLTLGTGSIALGFGALMVAGLAASGTGGSGDGAAGPTTDAGPRVRGIYAPGNYLDFPRYSRTPGPTNAGGERLDFETLEYFSGNFLHEVNAASRYPGGGFGDGVLVSILDSGIDTDHPEFEGRIRHELSVGYTDDLQIEDRDGHGTHVAGIIAAARDNTGMHGVAPEADMMILAGIVANPGTFAPEFNVIADAINRSAYAGARVMNNSWGSVRPIDLNDPNSPKISITVDYFGSVAGALAFIGTDTVNAMKYAAAQDTVLVFATGNSALDSMSINGGIVAGIPEAQNHVVNVVALDANVGDVKAGFSNACGPIAMEFCISAPGVTINSAAIGGGYRIEDGTSMAAPVVAGAIASLVSEFPEITGATAVDIIYDTARDIGDLGVDPIFGHGALDLERAMRPVGVLSVPLTGSASGPSVALSETWIASTNSAMAGAFRSALSTQSLGITDSYVRGYAVDASLTVHDARDTAGRTRLMDFALGNAPLDLDGLDGTYLIRGPVLRGGAAEMADPIGFAGGYAGLIDEAAPGVYHQTSLGGGASLSLGYTSPDGRHSFGPSFMNIGLSQQIGNHAVHAEFGQLSETDAILGTYLSGAFAGVRSDTSVMRFGADLKLAANTGLHLNAAFGSTSFSGQNVLQGGSFGSSTFSVGVSHKFDADRNTVSFGVTRDMAISGGQMTTRTPVGVMPASNGGPATVVYRTAQTALQSLEAPVRVTMGFEREVGTGRVALAASQGLNGSGGGTNLGVGFKLSF